MSTAIIPRDPTTPSPRVLEVDGPRFRHLRRSERPYYLTTDNQPCLPVSDLSVFEAVFDPRLCEDSGEPYWELCQLHDGTHEFHACRPSHQEAMDGDLHGALGSVIKFHPPSRQAYLYAFSLARKLAKCHPKRGILISPYCPHGTNITINSPIPIAFDRLVNPEFTAF
jgi:hypothetical protein